MELGKYLVTEPSAVSFLDLTHGENGLWSLLGDERRVDEAVRVDLVGAHHALRDGVAKIERLTVDETRTEVAKHGAGKKVADAVVGKLEATKKNMEARAQHLIDNAWARANEALGPKPERAALESEIRTWAASLLATGGDGLAKLKAAAKGNADLASVIWHSPAFLLGLPEELHQTMRFEALQAHRPELDAQIEMGMHMQKVAAGIAKAITRTQHAFYRRELAEKAAKRVEV